MFVQVRKITVTEGNSKQVVNQFSKKGILEEQEGVIDIKVMVKKIRRGEEEVMILVNWESEDYWKQWEKSDVHIAGHKAKRNQPKPDYIINTEVAKYEVKAVKQGIGGQKNDVI
ncbi:antibiotic biosynthesis monooxygenase family protein [Bacillus taeanensis]|uniref:Antibiotic biosynthesis monooxygenase n=1 Tax=Bacillus taeanensis TaxID=273032 RepID=A0A366XRM3_9BACI|nr:antibiotic biosynthesis monooxygenase [Bacillus taeanensis]RBW68782.1 antibiotic biosynthesis monooxygenase [Bacillus taeanensis]